MIGPGPNWCWLHPNCPVKTSSSRSGHYHQCRLGPLRAWELQWIMEGLTMDSHRGGLLFSPLVTRSLLWFTPTGYAPWSPFTSLQPWWAHWLSIWILAAYLLFGPDIVTLKIGPVLSVVHCSLFLPIFKDGLEAPCGPEWRPMSDPRRVGLRICMNLLPTVGRGYLTHTVYVKPWPSVWTEVPGA